MVIDFGVFIAGSPPYRRGLAASIPNLVVGHQRIVLGRDLDLPYVMLEYRKKGVRQAAYRKSQPCIPSEVPPLNVQVNSGQSDPYSTPSRFRKPRGTTCQPMALIGPRSKYDHPLSTDPSPCLRRLFVEVRGGNRGCSMVTSG